MHVDVCTYLHWRIRARLNSMPVRPWVMTAQSAVINCLTMKLHNFSLKKTSKSKKVSAAIYDQLVCGLSRALFCKDSVEDYFCSGRHTSRVFDSNLESRTAIKWIQNLICNWNLQNGRIGSWVKFFCENPKIPWPVKFKVDICLRFVYNSRCFYTYIWA
jgi:hypothetical protein